MRGAQRLSGRVLDSKPRGRGFEPHRRHCVVSLSKNINPSLALVQPRKTRPFVTEILLMGRKKSNQTKQTKMIFGTEAKAQASLCKYADSPEPSLPAHETEELITLSSGYACANARTLQNLCCWRE